MEPKGSPREPEWTSRAPNWTPWTPQGRPKTPQIHPKTPKDAKMEPKWNPRGAKGSQLGPNFALGVKKETQKGNIDLELNENGCENRES